MKRLIYSVSFVLLISIGFSSCKSKKAIADSSETSKTVGFVTDAPNTNEEYINKKAIDSYIEEKVTFDKEHDYEFHIVVGSFANIDNASNLCRNLDEKSYMTFLATNAAGKHRVIIKSFNSYKEAKAELPKFRKMFSDAWILKALFD